MTEYSHSRIQSFQNCPKSFSYRYIEKIESSRESIEAFVGKRVHEILERLYHHVDRYGKPPSLNQALERFRKDWLLHWHPHVEIIKLEFDIPHYQQLGERCLQHYYRRFYPFDQDETVGIEKMIHFRLDPDGRYRFRGVIDRIVRTAPGRYEIHDYKTGGYLPPRKRIDKDPQLALYQIGLSQTYDDVEEVELVWHYLAHNKTLRSRRTPEQLEELSQTWIALVDRIESANEFPTRVGPLCRWCEYRGICPAMHEGTPPPDPAIREPEHPQPPRQLPLL